MDKYYAKIIHRIFNRLPYGHVRIVNPDKVVRIYGEDRLSPAIVVQVNNWRFYKRLALGGDIGLGEAFIDKDWDADNPTEFIEWLLSNNSHLPQKGRIGGILSAIKNGIERVRHQFNSNTEAGSKKNIMAHYDLGNDLYERFLDASMTYSSGYFENSTNTLQDSQLNKYERLCQKLGLKAGMHVLEVGCGWGGFAEYAARMYGCKVTGITLSPSQLEYAEKRIERQKLQDKVDFQLCDYRKVQGQFDAIVSIEMLEAVGHDFLESFFTSCNRVLKKDGLMAVQVITCPNARYDDYRKTSDFIRKHVFPGGHLPSQVALQEAAAAETTFDIVHLESFGQHYGRTLQLWREKFLENWESITEFGYDERFKRLWVLYLAYCEAAFNKRHINVIQCVWSRMNEKGMANEAVSAPIQVQRPVARKSA